jgi:hypothetical protein
MWTKNPNAKVVHPAPANRALARRPAGLRVQTHLKAGETIRLNFTK